MKFSVPVLEVALVASLFFGVPIASVVIDVGCMTQSHGHQQLSLWRMIQIVTSPPQIDMLKRDQAARIRREALEGVEGTADVDFATSDPHASPSSYED